MTKLARRKYRVNRENFLIQLEHCMLNGEWNQKRLTARFNCDQSVISRAMTAIRDRWREQEDPYGKMDEKRRFRIKQLDYAFAEAMNAWHKSKKVQVEKTVKSEPCGFCASTGSFSDKDGTVLECPMCKGTGVRIEMVTKKTRSQGDATYLNTALRAHKEACLLDVMYPERKRERMSIGIGANGMVNSVNIESVYENAPTDDLLDVMAAIEELKVKSKNVEQNGQVIDVEPTKVESRELVSA